MITAMIVLGHEEQPPTSRNRATPASTSITSITLPSSPSAGPISSASAVRTRSIIETELLTAFLYLHLPCSSSRNLFRPRNIYLQLLLQFLRPTECPSSSEPFDELHYKWLPL